MSLTLLYLDKNPLLGFDENIILPSRSSYSRMKYQNYLTYSLGFYLPSYRDNP